MKEGSFVCLKEEKRII